VAKRWAGAIQSPADVRRILDSVNTTGLEKANTTALAAVARPAEDFELQPDASKLLPAPPELEPLLPWPGLRRGATIAVTASTSLLMHTLAAAMRDGSWAAVVGMPAFGPLAAHEAGVPLDRLALIPDPGPDWPTIVGALIDGVDLVVVATPAPAESVVRSLQGRARQRGAVLIPTTAWPGADVTIGVTERAWTGLDHGRGRLKQQHLTLEATGRGRAARPRTTKLSLGVPDGPVRIPPPPPGLIPDEQDGPESPLWARLEPNDPPRDAWTGLEQQIPLPGKKRR
jgi:hypothetical protein